MCLIITFILKLEYKLSGNSVSSLNMEGMYQCVVTTGPLLAVEDSPPSKNLDTCGSPFTPFTPANKHEVNSDSSCILFLRRRLASCFASSSIKHARAYNCLVFILDS